MTPGAGFGRPAPHETLVAFRGGGELGTAGARLLFLGGYRVAVLERPDPLAVRRRVAFAEAILAGTARVAGVEARRVERAALADAIAAGGWVPVVADPAGECLRGLGPRVLVDARMAKRNLGTTRDDAPLVIGLGPGFTAGRDVHAVVETHRGPTMGAVLWRGPARADTGLPTPVMGAAEARVLRAPAVGVFHAGVALGALVDQGEVVGEVGGRPVVACVGGLVRGLIADGVRVEAGLKLGDVDPRGAAADPAALSDKGRAVAAGVLEAVLVGLARSEA